MLVFVAPFCFFDYSKLLSGHEQFSDPQHCELHQSQTEKESTVWNTKMLARTNSDSGPQPFG